MMDDILPYSILSLDLGTTDACLSAMCKGLRVIADVHLENLSTAQDGAEAFDEQFTTFLETIDTDMQPMEALQDWIISPCLRYLQHVKDPWQRQMHADLQSYYNPETVSFALFATHGHLEARPCHHNAARNQQLVPRISWSKVCTQENPALDLPCYAAMQVQIIRDSEVPEFDLDDIPRAVQIAGVTSKLFFKAVSDDDSFQRELNALLRIRANKTEELLQASQFAGLVQCSDGSILGLLVQYIEGARTLDWAAEESSEEDRRKWCIELRSTLEQLHGLDLVWGDVKPENIVVDAENRAWLIDFGGGYSPDWVDKSFQDTKDGDLQGLSRIKAYLEQMSVI